VIQGSETAGRPGTRSGRKRADETGPDQARPDQARPDQARPDQARPDQARPDQARADQAGPNQASTDETLADAFLSVSRRLRETSQEILAPWDINPSQFRALRVLNHHGAIRLSDLSGRLHIAPRSATEVVDALESRGLVERRPDPSDRRATLAELTEHGTGVLRAIRAARGTEAERVFDRLSPADRDHLARILRQLQG
jgi:DNA-binding MarR family transcriptional regulator